MFDFFFTLVTLIIVGVFLLHIVYIIKVLKSGDREQLKQMERILKEN